jgi:hypothetical protein
MPIEIDDMTTGELADASAERSDAFAEMLACGRAAAAGEAVRDLEAIAREMARRLVLNAGGTEEQADAFARELLRRPLN